MIARYAESTNSCYGQFIISPENESERTALTNMIRLAHRNKAEFGFHGDCYELNRGLISFNCGFEDTWKGKSK